MKYKKKVKMIVLLLCLLVMAVSIYHICTYWQQEQASLQLNDDLMNKATKSTDTQVADEESDAPNDYNAIENSSFDDNLENWTCSENSAVTIEKGRACIIGDATLDKSFSQTIEVNKINPVFAIRVCSEGLAVPQDSASDGKYQISYVLNFSDGTNYAGSLKFNPDVSDRQYVYGSINARLYGLDKTVTSISVGPEFSKNCNTVHFDDGITILAEKEGNLREQIFISANVAFEFLAQIGPTEELFPPFYDFVKSAYFCSRKLLFTKSRLDYSKRTF